LRELALHVLDLIENAIRAGAARIEVCVDEQPGEDLLFISVEDDGPGLPVSAEAAMDPFFTTKEGKKTGLGLSLFRFRVEQAGGEMKLERSPLGGLAVRARMRLGHVDRSPLGDLASTLASVVCTNPAVELRSRLRVGCRESSVSSTDVARTLPFGKRGEIAVARQMREKITEGLSALRVVQ
jgi:anti-sigma regulatory factor (Ser/Thr protein kinase)